ncbi:hypothetical protein Tco_1437090 [Tanacetum coccineum]
MDEECTSLTKWQDSCVVSSSRILDQLVEFCAIKHMLHKSSSISSSLKHHQREEKLSAHSDHKEQRKVAHLGYRKKKWGMKKNEEFRSLFILEMILEAKVSFVTRRGHVGGLEDDEERLLDEFHELETSFDVLDTPCDVAAK